MAATLIKSGMYHAVHVTKSKAHKILEVFTFDSANYSFFSRKMFRLILSTKVSKVWLYFKLVTGISELVTRNSVQS